MTHKDQTPARIADVFKRYQQDREIVVKQFCILEAVVPAARKQIAAFQSDGGGEFDSYTVKNWAKIHDGQLRKSAVRAHYRLENTELLDDDVTVLLIPLAGYACWRLIFVRHKMNTLPAVKVIDVDHPVAGLIAVLYGVAEARWDLAPTPEIEVDHFTWFGRSVQHWCPTGRKLCLPNNAVGALLFWNGHTIDIDAIHHLSLPVYC
ncbi:uncharacterized protein N7515_009381 [Penicillium bovifimosum]|uniref:Uncharacterized protein n=1 Tax=Penicillium bovifimosum TaxID=126998 RepID=A0A9W9GJH3_9EURO|nr:uncharacterized protein N7515_009381 [Penicillium bovifimosum]KAJ5121420.1 hypothetical protein N7515_009381 [Penicillium bovifimosum]